MSAVASGVGCVRAASCARRLAHPPRLSAPLLLIITALTATTLAGDVLWQTGTPSNANGRAYCDLPVQIYDWDRDGRNEVLYVRQAKYLDPYDGKRVRERASRYEGSATMIVLDAATGREKATFPLPAPADDAIFDLAYVAQVKDLLQQARDLIKFIPYTPSATPEMARQPDG